MARGCDGGQQPISCWWRHTPLALLHLILWLIHAVVRALATAIVDVFTSLTGMILALVAVVVVATGVAGAFGLGGFGLWSRRKRDRAGEL